MGAPLCTADAFSGPSDASSSVAVPPTDRTPDCSSCYFRSKFSKLLSQEAYVRSEIDSNYHCQGSFIFFQKDGFIYYTVMDQDEVWRRQDPHKITVRHEVRRCPGSQAQGLQHAFLSFSSLSLSIPCILWGPHEDRTLRGGTCWTCRFPHWCPGTQIQGMVSDALQAR